MAVVAVAAAVALLILSGDDGPQSANPAATPEPVATQVASPTATREPPAPISVVFESHQDHAMAGVGWDLGPRPDSVFPPWHGTDAVIYDTATGRVIDLGEGGMIAFSRDSRYAAWIRGEWYLDAIGFPAVRGDAWILTLATGDQRRIGQAQAVTFVDSDRIALQAPPTPFEDARWELFDIATLQPSADQTTEPPIERPARRTSTGHILTTTPVAGSALPRGGYGAATWQLLDPADGHVVMQFEAFAVADATATELVVARALSGLPTEPFRSVHVQVYILDVTTGQAKWIGQAAASTPNWNLSANEKYVLWTNNFCAEEGLVEVLILERGSLYRGYAGEPGEPLEPGTDVAWMFLTPSGLIAQGTFGATALIDPATLKYTSVLPEVRLARTPFGDWVPVHPSWSPDYRYATYYFAGGHGGLC